MDALGFFDVFPQLNIEKDLEKVLRDTTVTKVACGQNKEDIRIYLTFNVLIPKRRIWHLENNIKKQIFPKEQISVKILEQFNLSEQYNISNLYDAYSDSVLEEI